ncbi:hypothetical protein DY000_02055347 [Brassica cretica]|uniref:Auxin efflux carrier component n=1 Tax=Brassica cretica TaxID=69181 RepID=A0ABQ7AFT3_BRACR|nr:hypothetical protein DY000_02055347 [Brassica cretica]
MITWHDLYTVLTAVIPLYVAMILAYGSVRCWKIFSPDQCSGINRFVAIFASRVEHHHLLPLHASRHARDGYPPVNRHVRRVLLLAHGPGGRSPVYNLEHGMTPRPSNITGAEIYSLDTTPRGSNFNHSDFYSVMGFSGGRPSNFGQSSRSQTPRPSNFEVSCGMASSPGLGYDPGSYPSLNAQFSSSVANKTINKNHHIGGKSSSSHDANELHKFAWGSNGGSDQGPKEIRMIVPEPPQKAETKDFGGEEESERVKEVATGRNKLQCNSMAELNPKEAVETVPVKHMPPASVMTRWNVAMPRIIHQSISILSDAGLGMAMFSLGLFMALQPKLIACGNSTATFAMAVRFLTGPAVMAVAAMAIGLRGDLLRVAIVQAALPQGIMPFVFAKEYNVHPAILSTGVIFGMLIALPITLVYYILLGL